VGGGKAAGWGMATRMFGSILWGFNPLGYVKSNISLKVTNKWFNCGIGGMILPNASITLQENYYLLADDWHLDDGADVVSTGRKGTGADTDKEFYKQVDRMYFSNPLARGLVNAFSFVVRGMTSVALGLGQIKAQPDIGATEFVQAAVVSKNYKSESSGRVSVSQDRGGNADYDTAPLGLRGNGSKDLDEYGNTLKDRGQYFMGCKREMSMGCPSATLQQDNPFGDYIYRE
jgi:hypothetical protein